MYYTFLLSNVLIDLWGWFHALAVVNSATVSTGVQIIFVVWWLTVLFMCWLTIILFGHAQGGTTRSSDIFIFVFVEKAHTDFLSGYASLHSY